VARELDRFEATKRLHHLLHGRPGDGGDLDQSVRGIYDQIQKETLAELQPRISPGDVVVLYDPQTIGLAPELKRLGATVVWSCHVGIDQPNDLARTAWEFLRPYVQAADAYVFSRPAYCWEGLDRDRMAVIPPCIDAFAPKNQPLATPAVNAILQAAGILDAPEGDRPAPMFQHLDGSPGRVVRRAEMIQDEPIPPGVPIVLQVSRLGSAQGPAGRRPGVHRPRPRPAGRLPGPGRPGGHLGERRPRERAGPPAGAPGRGSASHRGPGPTTPGLSALDDLEENGPWSTPCSVGPT
jgi:trehalose synthase